MCVCVGGGGGGGGGGLLYIIIDPAWLPDTIHSHQILG